jgi:hypothetical protein
MFNLFLERHGDEFEQQEWLYREIFHSQPLKIGSPRSDTCATCDKLFIGRSRLNPEIAEDRVLLEDLELQTISHHHDAEVGYQELRDDCEKSRQDDSYITVCVDMQSVRR